MATAMVALAHQVGAKSVREAVFLSTFPSSDLPKAMLVSALSSMPLALVVTRAMTRWGLHIVAPTLFAVSSLLWSIEWLLLPVAPTTVAVILYLHVSVGGAILLSTFWSVISECFDPHSLKRLVGRIGAAGTFGGMVGGALIERTSHWFYTRSTMLVLASVSAVAAILVGTLARGQSPTRQAEKTTGERRSPHYLRCIALLVFSSALVTTFADFALKQAAAARYSDAADLVRYFALFYTASSVVGFLLQISVSRRVLEVAGVGATLAATPGAVLVFGAAAAMSPSLMPIAALKAAELSLNSSLFRSAYEPLFAPVPAALKRSMKAILDVTCDKGGEVVGASLILVLALGGAGELPRVPILLACAVAAICIHLSFLAQRGYVAELESSLRAGTVTIDARELVDPMAQLTLSGAAVGLDRAKLLEYVAQLQATGDVPMASQPTEQLLADIRALLESDLAATRQVLRKPDLDPRLAAFTIPLLAINGLAREATDALRTMGRPAVALMGDVMHSSDAPLVVRRRIPHVLRTTRGTHVIEVLTNALEVEQFVVRSRAAMALREVLSHSGGNHPEPDRLLRFALREAGGRPLNAETTDHLLVLLVLGTGQESLDLVRQGLRNHDQKIRGTAVEYLESLLPESVRSVVVAALTAIVPMQRGQPRAVRELGDELERSVDLHLAPTYWSDDFG
jgi:ATP:ADP antiporter, AAA family